MSSFHSFVDVLRARSEDHAARLAIRYLENGLISASEIDYGELDRRAKAIAVCLLDRFKPGDRALLLLSPGIDFIATFCGCLYSGIVAIPVGPPPSGKSRRRAERLLSVASDSDPAVLLTSFSFVTSSGRLIEDLGILPWMAVDNLPENLDCLWRYPDLAPDSLAFLQYTSGSTADPKGVKVTHGNLIHNQRAISLAFKQSEHTHVVTWLPMHHDMGLIGSVLQPLFVGASCTAMSPESFLRRPLSWLEAISHFGASTSGAPNSAYELCVQWVSEQDRDKLNLGQWQVAFCGSETIRHETLQAFADYFQPCGFSYRALRPCYGLAEATLLRPAATDGCGPTVRMFDKQSLGAGVAKAGASALVSCGQAASGTLLEIVDPRTRETCRAGNVGEIWLSGGNVAGGYFGRSDESAELFGATRSDLGDGPWLRTGDLGFVVDNELFVTGRIKVLIIIGASTIALKI